MAVIVVGAASVSVVSAAGPLTDLAAFGYNPAATDTIVVAGKARFTVLSNALIRAEYSSAGTFEDRATLAVVNRRVPTPAYTTSNENGWFIIKTPKVTLQYRNGTAFSATTLQGTAANGAAWNYGEDDGQNLLGTIKSLDLLCNPSLNCTQATYKIHDESLHCTWGVTSRGGWAVYDDTKNYILSGEQNGWFTNEDRGVSDVDIYWFGHGLDYKGSVKDLSTIAGRQQLFSRNMLGTWFTRWFDYDNDDLAVLLDRFDKTDLPLDVLILDMNWHTKNSWTGYTMDRQLYPIPMDTVNMVHSKGLKMGANIHDAVGFGEWEEKYATMAATLNIDPATRMTVPFSPLNSTYMHTMEDKVLKELGFDIWWIDWQQGGNFGGLDGYQMNPTFITDHVRSTDNLRRGDNVRDGILARWGGMGSQRYPVGFSGDVLDLSWECMRYQPYFVATAANVGYGTISNDYVGPADDHELHVRWMQFAAYSPILRIHDRGMSSGGCASYGNCAIVDMWLLPFKYLNPIRAAMKERNALLPYMYTATRATFDTGLAMIRPMYYEYPECNSAYAMSGSGNAQYFFGDDMFVAPVTDPSGQPSGLVTSTVWLPPGTWYDNVFGELHTVTNAQGTPLIRQYTLDDTPVFLKAGAVIPRISNPTEMAVAGKPFTELDWMVYPGAPMGKGSLYEDDGQSHGYMTGKYATSTANFTLDAAGETLTVTVSAVKGSYTGMPASRDSLRVLLEGYLPASMVRVGGVTIPYARFLVPGVPSYSYDGATGRVIVQLGTRSVSEDVVVTVSFPQSVATVPLPAARLKVFASRMKAAKATTDVLQDTPFETTYGPGYTKRSAAHAGYITALAAQSPQDATALMGSNYTSLMRWAVEELGGQITAAPPPRTTERMLLQLWGTVAGRHDMLLCGSIECAAVNPLYNVMWIEGYQPAPTSPDAVRLYDYWSAGTSDNWATTQATPPFSGWSDATFSNGYVMNASGPGRACIDVYFKSSINDHFTTSSTAGHQWATAQGYEKVNNCIGYAYTDEPADQGSRGGALAKEAALAEAKKAVQRARVAMTKAATADSAARTSAVALIQSALAGVSF